MTYTTQQGTAQGRLVPVLPAAVTVTVADSQHTGSSASDTSIDSSGEQQRPARVRLYKRVALLPVNIV
jgi:hypothetical protein